MENEKLNTTIKTQQQLVIQLSQEVQKQRIIIHGLTQQIGSLTQQIQQWTSDLFVDNPPDLIHLLD
jgi:uncharacterized coiled-coil protein SlyX